jgi:hypothetical protein
MAALLMCPHCGWKYDPQQYRRPDDDGRAFALVPAHDWQLWSPVRGQFGVECPGTEQCPRNPEADRRPLWKDLPPRPE